MAASRSRSGRRSDCFRRVVTSVRTDTRSPSSVRRSLISSVRRSGRKVLFPNCLLRPAHHRDRAPRPRVERTGQDDASGGVVHGGAGPRPGVPGPAPRRPRGRDPEPLVGDDERSSASADQGKPSEFFSDGIAQPRPSARCCSPRARSCRGAQPTPLGRWLQHREDTPGLSWNHARRAVDDACGGTDGVRGRGRLRSPAVAICGPRRCSDPRGRPAAVRVARRLGRVAVRQRPRSTASPPGSPAKVASDDVAKASTGQEGGLSGLKQTGLGGSDRRS